MGNPAEPRAYAAESRPSRRTFISSAAAALAGACVTSPDVGRNVSRPNVLIIQTDQQSNWTLGVYGGTLVETPWIDSLARDGVTAENFFTNSPLCTPSRGCFMTGRYPHLNGSIRNNDPLNVGEITFARTLRDAGYKTGYAGKWHLEDKASFNWGQIPASRGFDDTRYLFNNGHFQRIHVASGVFPTPRPGDIGVDSSYSTDWLADKTMDFITEHRREPFCYMVSFPDPHPPFTVRNPYDSMYSAADMPLPENFITPSNGGTVSEHNLRRHKTQYCAMVKCIDDNVGKILRRIDQLGLRDNTVVVFTSDHGEYMGEHGRMGKNYYYETAIRIPFIVRWPSQIPSGARVTQATSSVDFLPTLLDLVGVQSSGAENGSSFASMLRAGAPVGRREPAFVYHSDNQFVALFTQDYEIVLHRRIPNSMFDRQDDPLQVNNLWDDKSLSALRDSLVADLRDHHTMTNSPALSWLP